MDNTIKNLVENFKYFYQVQEILQQSANLSFVTREPDPLKDTVWVTPQLARAISNPTIIYEW